MDDLSIDQLLACTQVIMKDEEKGMAVTAVWTTQEETRKFPCGPILCHRYNGPNNSAKDCKGYKCDVVGHISHNCLENKPGE